MNQENSSKQALSKRELVQQHAAISHDQVQLQRAQAGLKTMQLAMELLATVNQPKRFMRASMAFCNELTSQWACERVSLGLIKGRYIRLKATSHCEHFSRKMELVQDIESAMEECFDQDTEVIHPAAADAMYISKATAHLAQRHGPCEVLSVPLRLNGEVQAVVTLERPAGQRFDDQAVEGICLACNLGSSRLLNLWRHDRWFGAKWWDGFQRGLGFVLGAQHTGAKLVCLLIIAFLVFAVVFKGQYRTKSSCLLEATVQQSICAPFDGYLKAVHKEAGDEITDQDNILAALDTAELRLQLAAAKAENVGYLKQRDAYERDFQTAEAQIAQADADKAQAQIELLDYQISQAQLMSPIIGIVVTGDLKRQVGAPVKTGDVLFEVAPLDTLRAQVLVSEDQILDISTGQEGELATVSYPDRRIPFVVERISPMAEVENNRNVFKVRVRLLETYEQHEWMRPGMEGVAKITVGKRRYVWIWTRKLINWIRMKLWI